MNKTVSKLILAAGIALALVFTFSCSSDDGGTSPQLILACPISSVSDGSVTCGGKTYKTVKIGKQTWFAENLNYRVSGLCGNKSTNQLTDNDADCEEYGRLYNWATAMNLEPSCNNHECLNQIESKHQGICPSGWHIPNNADWDELYRYVDGNTETSSPYNSKTAGIHLKAKIGWDSCGPYDSDNTYVCQDTYGFSALPGGYGIDIRDIMGNDILSGGAFSDAGEYGLWWSASDTENYNNHGNIAYFRGLGYSYEGAGWDIISKAFLYSIRCLKDD